MGAHTTGAVPCRSRGWKVRDEDAGSFCLRRGLLPALRMPTFLLGPRMAALSLPLSLPLPHKATDPILRAPASRPHLARITSRGPVAESHRLGRGFSSRAGGFRRPEPEQPGDTAGPIRAEHCSALARTNSRDAASTFRQESLTRPAVRVPTASFTGTSLACSPPLTEDSPPGRSACSAR